MEEEDVKYVFRPDKPTTISKYANVLVQMWVAASHEWAPSGVVRVLAETSCIAEVDLGKRAAVLGALTIHEDNTEHIPILDDNELGEMRDWLEGIRVSCTYTGGAPHFQPVLFCRWRFTSEPQPLPDKPVITPRIAFWGIGDYPPADHIVTVDGRPVPVVRRETCSAHCTLPLPDLLAGLVWRYAGLRVYTLRVWFIPMCNRSRVLRVDGSIVSDENKCRIRERMCV
jgi:hypothetical protein